jgi:ubiquinone/menaquinone biosynthesis C-methylase UbiE
LTFNNPLTEMAMGYFRSRVLVAAARLGVADAFQDGELTTEQLATACQADPGSLYRLLRALASFGVVVETKPGSFELTDEGRALRKDAPQSEWPSIVFWGDLLADNWSYLTDCVRAGKKAEAVRPESVPSRWSQDPEAHSIFRAVMGTAPAEAYMPIALAWDFSKYKVVADLGGGGGTLIAAVLEAFPHVRGMLVDYPDAIERAATRFKNEGLAERCTLLAADLRTEVPAGADVYMLKHVLHGYDDNGAVDVLRRCRSVLPAEGRLLVMEFLLPDVVDDPDAEVERRLMSDLNMLVVTGGRERSAVEWAHLLETAGLRCLRVIPVFGHSTSIVEASRD